MAVYLTHYTPEWLDGTPPDGADGEWLGESADGRKWLLWWSPASNVWMAVGFDPTLRVTAPEARLLREENAGFIVRSMDLPSSRVEESAAADTTETRED